MPLIWVLGLSMSEKESGTCSVLSKSSRVLFSSSRSLSIAVGDLSLGAEGSSGCVWMRIYLAERRRCCCSRVFEVVRFGLCVDVIIDGCKGWRLGRDGH